MDMRDKLARIRAWAKSLKRDLVALSMAVKDPRTPWYARAWSVGILAYALSPIDLIPDWIPVFGYLDDLLIVPVGLAIAIRWIPSEVIQEYREKADHNERLPPNWFMGGVFICLWAGSLAAAAWFFWRR